MWIKMTGLWLRMPGRGLAPRRALAPAAKDHRDFSDKDDAG